MTTVNIALEGGWLAGGQPGPHITVSGNYVRVDMSAFRRPPATGTIVSQNQIRVTFPDDSTFIGTLTASPDAIHWSNSIVWTRTP